MSQLTIPAKKKQPEKTLSWGEVDWMLELALSKMHDAKYLPEVLVPIGGGGIIPAAILAYRLYKRTGVAINVMPPIYCKSYDHLSHEQGQLSMTWYDSLKSYDGFNTLFVDDICDTGRTLWAISERMPKSQAFAIVTKVAGLPSWFSTYDGNNHWWNFPWEKVPAPKPKGETK
jgi:hypoxanthine phosphoribosyltransferase